MMKHSIYQFVDQQFSHMIALSTMGCLALVFLIQSLWAAPQAGSKARTQLGSPETESSAQQALLAQAAKIELPPSALETLANETQEPNPSETHSEAVASNQQSQSTDDAPMTEASVKSLLLSGRGPSIQLRISPSPSQRDCWALFESAAYFRNQEVKCLNLATQRPQSTRRTFCVFAPAIEKKLELDQESAWRNLFGAGSELGSQQRKIGLILYPSLEAEMIAAITQLGMRESDVQQSIQVQLTRMASGQYTISQIENI